MGRAPAPHVPPFARLAAVESAVIACERCPRLRAWCQQVAREKRREFRDQTYWGRPVPGFGDPAARVLVGRVGREAWLKASGWWERLPPRERPRFGHGVEARLPDGTLVICSFHP